MTPKLIIVSAPSGAGKSTLVSKALGEISEIVDIITYTTRKMRSGESEGHPYHFVSPQKFSELKDHGFFVESAIVHGNCYGTPRDQIETAWKNGRFPIMDVDVQGADTLHKVYPRSVMIFIVPPSIDELRRRVLQRDKGQTPDLEIRMRNAVDEIRRASDFDYQIVNEKFDESYAQFKKIIEEIVKSR